MYYCIEARRFKMITGRCCFYCICLYRKTPRKLVSFRMTERNEQLIKYSFYTVLRLFKKSVIIEYKSDKTLG